MAFKTELHCHTAEVSRCGRVSAADTVETYIRHGYDSVTITNHLSASTFSEKNQNFVYTEDWQKRIDFFMNGIHLVEEAAKGRIHVLWGVELCGGHDGNDYLIYGITEEQLRAMPDLLNISIKEFGPRIRQELGLLLFQAHPFRNGVRIVVPERLDGVEVYNGHIGHDSRNYIASDWATRYGLRRISGTDFHQAVHIPTGGILTEAPIRTNAELAATLKSGNYTLLHDGEDPVKVCENL
ncbi:MAG: hypothetical protein IKL89_09290 [Clostridia bacterium]|nr:hypothetical protein [Clostridia bacterium]